jgi:hypothetical protein
MLMMKMMMMMMMIGLCSLDPTYSLVDKGRENRRKRQLFHFFFSFLVDEGSAGSRMTTPTTLAWDQLYAEVYLL